MALLFAALLGLSQAEPPTAGQPVALAALCQTLAQRQDPDAASLHSLASCLYRGDGLTQDLPRARALYTRAVDRGFAQSQCALGNMMIRGEGGPRDVAGGLALCRRAAEAGNAQAQADLGGYLLTGATVPRDVVEARRWFTLAARQRQPNAAYTLGQIYWNGDGVAKDNGEAARWWRIAFEGGRLDAAYLLGHEAFVRITRGVRRPQDADPDVIDEAIRWYERAADADPSPANREDAARKLTMLREFQAGQRQQRNPRT